MTINHLSVREIWEKIEPVLVANPEPYEHLTTVYELHLDEEVYQLQFQKGQITFVESPEQEADCTLTLSREDFLKFLQGNLNSTMAFMTGKLKIKGNISLALTLENIIKKYDLFE